VLLGCDLYALAWFGSASRGVSMLGPCSRQRSPPPPITESDKLRFARARGQLLAHQAGLFAINEPVGRSDLQNLDRLAAILAREKPEWEPGTRQAYHGLSLGFYEGELMRRLDAQHRTLGQFFHEEIASGFPQKFLIRD
jgi:Beta-lactamase